MPSCISSRDRTYLISGVFRAKQPRLGIVICGRDWWSFSGRLQKVNRRVNEIYSRSAGDKDDVHAPTMIGVSSEEFIRELAGE